MIITVLICLFSFSVQASQYVVGRGASYEMKMLRGPTVDISIYVVDKSLSDISIEYYMVENSIVGTELWQRFRLRRQGSKLNLIKGYYYSEKLKNPEIMPDEILKGQKKGVALEQFMFQKESEIKKYFVAYENLETPGKPVKATKYHMSQDDQKIDFWISPKALPIGLVKLISTSKKTALHNFEIRLIRLLKNVKAKIDPSKAVKATEVGLKLIPNKNQERIQ